jgi:hypothetical protein
MGHRIQHIFVILNSLSARTTGENYHFESHFVNTNNLLYCRAYRGDYYKTGIGLTTGFIGSPTITHNYSVYASQLTTIESILFH